MVNEEIENIKARIRCYGKYKAGDSLTGDIKGIEKFKTNHPKIYEQIDFNKNPWWNDWLFEYCFEDILKE